MASLLPSVWTTIAPAVPYVWSCSECEAAFDMGPMHGALPTQSQIDELNHQFEAHCRQVHPRLVPVSCLGDVPLQKIARIFADSRAVAAPIG